jgi:ribosomal protein S18 acetylase RimI-like enzyme
LSEINIRKAVKIDYQTIKKLMKELYESLLDKTGMDEHLTAEKFEEILAEQNIDILVAESNSEVIGYLTLRLQKSLIDTGPTAAIDEIIISKIYRQKGIGGLLVKSAIDLAIQQNCSEIGVGTEESNTIARKFYEKYGFKKRGVIFDYNLR